VKSTNYEARCYVIISILLLLLFQVQILSTTSKLQIIRHFSVAYLVPKNPSKSAIFVTFRKMPVL